uniref:LCCL domain-containing protein n=1 Tax=Petromyzon marinus TaxID=7757 RepID=S4R594_PETMA
IADDERRALTEYHNRLRASVHPQAADMEHMSWDWELAGMAEAWAKQCKWGHGPSDQLDAIGQNLAVYVGSERPLAYHVQAWFDEEEWYQYPEEKECSPECPHTCRGPICTHYTQLVWAESRRVGCAVHTCLDISVWDAVWPYALYLVCNYSPKGNWIGEAPYRQGTPCSRCPPRYGGSCRGGLCYQVTIRRPQRLDELSQFGVAILFENQNISVIVPRIPQPRNNSQEAELVLTGPVVPLCHVTVYTSHLGGRCNTYQAAAGGRLFSLSVFACHLCPQESGLCRSARHAGALGPGGGWIDVKRRGRTQTFTGSARNGVRSLGKRRPANSFSVSASPVREVSCKDTLRDICPIKFPPPPRCPRFVCPARCTQAHGIVVGTGIYSDVSS